MLAERIREIAAASRWLPGDYLRHLARVDPRPAPYRYGAQWFDGPQDPTAVWGDRVGALFPNARLIARRHGNFIGYSDWEVGRPRLREWTGSQQRVLHEFPDIATLVLSSILVPGYDSRPIVPRSLNVEGLAIGPWHDARSELTARCILLPDGENGLLGRLRDAFPSGWRLQLMQADGDSARSIRPAADGYEWCLDRHGSFGAWEGVGHEEVVETVRALVPFNDGSQPSHHGLLGSPVVEPIRN